MCVALCGGVLRGEGVSPSGGARVLPAGSQTERKGKIEGEDKSAMEGNTCERGRQEGWMAVISATGTRKRILDVYPQSRSPFTDSLPHRLLYSSTATSLSTPSSPASHDQVPQRHPGIPLALFPLEGCSHGASAVQRGPGVRLHSLCSRVYNMYMYMYRAFLVGESERPAPRWSRATRWW